MTTESSNDAFERRYLAKFENLAAEYGVTAKYSRDRAARDIGLHFFKKTKTGDEKVTGVLVWFQMKGVREKTLSLTRFEGTATVKVSQTP